MYKFTVVIPVYNTSKYLPTCLNSVLNQTYSNLEIIAIDDGSTDNSLEVLSSFKDPRLTIFHQDNQGVANTRNNGIDKATGDYIFFLDSDDFISLNYFEQVNDALIKFPGFIPMTSRFEFKEGETPKGNDYNQTYKFSDSMIAPITIQRIVFNLSTLRKFNIRFQPINHYEDAIFNNTYWGYSNCAKFVYIFKAFYFYLKGRSDSLCNSKSINKNHQRVINALPALKEHLDFATKHFPARSVKRANELYLNSLKWAGKS